jgi:hypothetical protein
MVRVRVGVRVRVEVGVGLINYTPKLVACPVVAFMTDPEWLELGLGLGLGLRLGLGSLTTPLN